MSQDEPKFDPFIQGKSAFFEGKNEWDNPFDEESDGYLTKFEAELKK